MTKQIRSGLAICSRRFRLVSTPRSAPSRRVALSLVVLLVAVCAGLLGGGRLLARASSAAPSPSASATPSAEKLTASAIQIEPVEVGDVQLPPEFRVAVYEYLIGEVSKSGKFQHVYRSGDRAAGDAPDLVTLRMKVKGFKQGSQKTREVTTVAGATSVDMGVQVTSRDGKALVYRDVEGKVRFFGGNLRATNDFSKKVTEILKQSF
jgi:hypothetical protein